MGIKKSLLFTQCLQAIRKKLRGMGIWILYPSPLKKNAEGKKTVSDVFWSHSGKSIGLTLPPPSLKQDWLTKAALTQNTAD